MGNRYAILAPTVDANKDGVISAGELARSAVMGAGFVLLALFALASVIVSLFWPGPVALRLFCLFFGVALCTGSVIGAWRLLYAIFELPHRWASQDRRRAIEAEEYERDRLDTLEDKAGDRISQLDIDNTARLMLLNYYAGKSWQRGSIKGVSDVKWNLANTALQKAGLRRGRSTRLDAENMAQAWEKYVTWRMSTHTFKVGDDGDLIAM